MNKEVCFNLDVEELILKIKRKFYGKKYLFVLDDIKELFLDERKFLI